MTFNTQHFFKLIEADSQHPANTDYETYLKTKTILHCQTPLLQLCNGDELQFQIVHQTEELWLKLISYTVIQICHYIENKDSYRILSLFKRIHRIQETMINLLSWLETMSPKEYQEIRMLLGNGSGRTSPGFRAVVRATKPLWQLYETNYLLTDNITIENIYNSQYKHDAAYAIAEALIEFDALFARFYKRHFDLIERTIGSKSKSLKGNDVDDLRAHESFKFFPLLWAIRNQMTDEWGHEYGYKRSSLAEQN